MSTALSLPGHLVPREREPLARHSTFGVGGPADLWVEVRTVDDLIAVLDAAQGAGIPRTVLGHGTNLLVADAGIEGLVVSNSCVGLTFDPAAGLAQVESGHTMARLARRAAAGGHAGLGFAIGVPGTVGGAVFGNAGAWGSDIATVLASADVWYPDGVRRVYPDEVAFGYRRSALQDDPQAPVVLGAALRIQPGTPTPCTPNSRHSRAAAGKLSRAGKMPAPSSRTRTATTRGGSSSPRDSRDARAAGRSYRPGMPTSSATTAPPRRRTFLPWRFTCRPSCSSGMGSALSRKCASWVAGMPWPRS